MTPTQLRAFAAVARLGSVKLAAAELDVSQPAVSLHVAQLRKELGDKLFIPTPAGLSFTPGGLRLASRAAELLGLQDQTILEVRQAGRGRRLLRVAASAMFAEHAAPGLIELFADRSKDLDVELSDHRPGMFTSMLLSRTVDVAIGPQPPDLDPSITSTRFLNYQVVAVTSPTHPLATTAQPSPRDLREQTWLLGPSAVTDTGVINGLLRRINVPENHQQIFQSHAAALDQAKRGAGWRSRSRSPCRRTWPTATCAVSRVRPCRPRGPGASSARRAQHLAGRRRADPVRDQARRDPGDAARHRGPQRPVPSEHPRDALELALPVGAVVLPGPEVARCHPVGDVDRVEPAAAGLAVRPVEPGHVRLDVRTGVPSSRSTPAKRTMPADTSRMRTRLSPIGLTRRGPRVAKIPIGRCWGRSRKGTWVSGAASPDGPCGRSSQVSSHA